jgi:hypothetical protein
VEDDLEGLPLHPRGWTAVQIWIERIPPNVLRGAFGLALVAIVRSSLGKSWLAVLLETAFGGFSLLLRLDQIESRRERRVNRTTDPMDPLLGRDDPWDE